MGTDVSVSVVTPDEPGAQHITDEVFAVITDYEKRFSRFNQTSELSTLNARGDLVVSEEYMIVLQRSYQLYTETGGAFNPLLQIARHGYDINFDDLQTTKDINQIIEPYNIDFSTLEIDQHTRRVTLQSGQRIDFGGILKGYLATKLAREISQKYPNCTGLIINIGGDLHTMGNDENDEEFIFYLYNPITDKETAVPVYNQALATSGSYKRTWGNTTPRHHILATNGMSNPSTDIVSASVIHPDGATAEAYATLILVSGLKRAKLLTNINDYQYFIVKQSGEVLTNIL